MFVTMILVYKFCIMITFNGTLYLQINNFPLNIHDNWNIPWIWQTDDDRDLYTLGKLADFKEKGYLFQYVLLVFHSLWWSFFLILFQFVILFHGQCPMSVHVGKCQPHESLGLYPR